MERLIVKTLFGQLTFTHENMKVKVEGNSNAIKFWKRKIYLGLEVPFGHLFESNSCLFSDLVYAVRSALGEKSFSLTETQIKKVRKEVRLPIPEGAVP